MDIEKLKAEFEQSECFKRLEHVAQYTFFEFGAYIKRTDVPADIEKKCGKLITALLFSWSAWKEAKAQAVPEWISVKNKLPKRNIKVLLNIVARRRGKPFSCIGFYSVEPDDEPCFILDDNFTILKGVTHWMQLPQAPKAQEPNND